MTPDLDVRCSRCGMPRGKHGSLFGEGQLLCQGTSGQTFVPEGRAEQGPSDEPQIEFIHPEPKSPVRLVTERSTYIAELNADAIEKLEQALEQARGQGFVAVAIAGVFPDGEVFITRSRAENRWTLMGALTRLLHHIGG